jgi:hypothetical protein
VLFANALMDGVDIPQQNVSNVCILQLWVCWVTLYLLNSLDFSNKKTLVL